MGVGSWLGRTLLLRLLSRHGVVIVRKVLEIKGEEITVLTEYKDVPASRRACRPLPPASEMEELRRQ